MKCVYLVSLKTIQMSQQRGAITLHRNGTIALRILAKPGAKSTAITDVGEDGIGVAIGAPPREGEANEELVSFIGKILDLKKSEIALDKVSLLN
ncbi:hypothetical protein DICVIV_06373 [Dictyocaulus viviparus]|uniref:Uncharacterized protein n=1 Tax=Dictyocaulus viviparus TaxID=29172 RepID=A0A0D8XUM3_DICVI|nr:hypothetical protein DICVIV_06373 [Dictyocaulus viviparus]